MKFEPTEDDFKKESKRIFKTTKKYARIIGHGTCRFFLRIYFTLLDRETPTATKYKFIMAIAYYIFPFDLINDKRHVFGKVDDFVAIYLAYRDLKKHVTPEILNLVEDTMNSWFPKDVIILGNIDKE